MLEYEGLENVLPGCSSVEEGVAIYHGFPGYRQGEAQHGVAAFQIEVCR